MEISKKLLRLGYEVEKNGKTSHHAISFVINKDADETLVKEVGEGLASLIKRDIENYSVVITQVL